MANSAHSQEKKIQSGLARAWVVLWHVIESSRSW